MRSVVQDYRTAAQHSPVHAAPGDTQPTLHARRLFAFHADATLPAPQASACRSAACRTLDQALSYSRQGVGRLYALSIIIGCSRKSLTEQGVTHGLSHNVYSVKCCRTAAYSPLPGRPPGYSAAGTPPSLRTPTARNRHTRPRCTR